MDNSKTYSVNLWGSHPDLENDDCWTGTEFATLAEALAAIADANLLKTVGFSTWESTLSFASTLADTEYFEIDGPAGSDYYMIVPNPHFNEKRRRALRQDDDWSRERTMQAGMAFGCDGYNDEMGF